MGDAAAATDHATPGQQENGSKPATPSDSTTPAAPETSAEPVASTSAAPAADEKPLNPNLPVCANCKTQTTPLWRRAENGTTLCNACSLYLKMKGTPRPVSLKTDVIKHRNRSKGESAQKKRQAALAAAAAAAAHPGFQNDDGQGYYPASRGTSHSRTREGAGQKSAPGGVDTDGDGDYYDDEMGEYKRARHHFNGHGMSPSHGRGSSRGRDGGSRSSSQQRRSDSSESRGYDHTPPPNGMMPPYAIPYPVFYYPPGAPGQPVPGAPAGAYPYGYPAPPPPPEWQAYMQQMQSAAAANGGAVHPGFMPPFAHPAQYAPPGQTNGATEHGQTLPPLRQAAGSRSQSVDSFARDVERGRASVTLPPLHASVPGMAPGLPSHDARHAGAPSAQYFHPYQRTSLHHARSAVSDARLTPPKETMQRRGSEPARPTSSASSSGGSQTEGRFNTVTSPNLQASKAPDQMRIDEVDESPDAEGEVDVDMLDNPAHGPIRGTSAHERRGRSSTRKPAVSVPHDVDERLGKMRMESPAMTATQMPPIAGTLPPVILPPGIASTANASAANSAAPANGAEDETAKLRMRVSELEFINSILQNRVTELERQVQPSFSPNRQSAAQ